MSLRYALHFSMAHGNFNILYNNVTHHSTSSRVVLFVLYTRCEVICDLLQYIHTEKCDLFLDFFKVRNIGYLNIGSVILMIVVILQHSFDVHLYYEIDSTSFLIYI